MSTTVASGDQIVFPDRHVTSTAAGSSVDRFDLDVEGFDQKVELALG